MIQRLLALLFIQWLLIGIAVAAPAADPSTRSTTTKAPEGNFIKGLSCLKQSDIACAEVAAAGIPSQSPYAKLLAGSIAASKGDFDTVFRLLLPLQANRQLTPEAIASLHTSLARAYEAQHDPTRALEQRVLAHAAITNPADAQSNQDAIWKLLTSLQRDELIEMRGESDHTSAQGWIDLALSTLRTGSREQAIAEWLQLYPDHSAAAGFAQKMAISTTLGASTAQTGTLSGPIALILPLSVEAFYPASDAIERGFVAAQSVAKDKNEVRMYATRADANEITTIYQHAVSEGVKYAVGPVTDAEVGSLAGNAIIIPTLALNKSEHAEGPANLYMFGLSVHDEARQLVRMAKRQGMQKAVVLATGSGISRLMAESFNRAWADGTGLTAQLIEVKDEAALSALRSSLAAQPVDFIVMALDFEEARRIRPHLDIATPTFGFSHIYSGLAYDPANAALSGIRFVDIPWVLKPDSAAFTEYKKASRDLPPGEMQRWFALGADAYRLLSAIVRNPSQAATLNGLTGELQLSPVGGISRELAVARFGVDGVTVEHLP